MPDPTKKTISATQVPALFNRSPYETRWTLYQKFVGALPWESDEENERMYWGKKLQPAILSAVADKLRLDVIGNHDDTYARHPDAMVGCTPDGYALDPQRGLGWIETKNVDWMVFKDQWTPASPPPHIVLQHQVQLMIPRYLTAEHDGSPGLVPAVATDAFPQWGIVAALVGGNDLHLYEFTPNKTLHGKIAAEAKAFMEQVSGHNEPPVTGDAVELPEIATIWPETVADKVLDVRGLPGDEAVATMIAEYLYASEQRGSFKRWEDQVKARLLRYVEDNQMLRASGYSFRVSKSMREGRVVSLPDSLLESVGCLLASAEGFSASGVPQATEAAVTLLRDWREVIAKAGITTRVTAKRIDGERDDTPAILREGDDL